MARHSSFATDQRRLKDGKGKSGPVHIQVAPSSFLDLSWLGFMDFREFLEASVDCGSVFHHRFPFPAKRIPIIVGVLFPSSLGTQSSMDVSVASPSFFVRCRGRC